MARELTLTKIGALTAGSLMLLAAANPAALSQAQPGVWEISGAPGTNGPVRQCLADLSALARYEHRTNNCVAKVSKDGGTSASIEYTCGGAGFGHSEIDMLTPRSLRISTQGISGGLPFNYVLQAHRVDDCVKTPASLRH
jgi:hypothetical protein